MNTRTEGIYSERDYSRLSRDEREILDIGEKRDMKHEDILQEMRERYLAAIRAPGIISTARRAGYLDALDDLADVLGIDPVEIEE